ncbi:MAG: hypothetical protein ACYDC6_06275 [Acidobacteriaceae bacterium]
MKTPFRPSRGLLVLAFACLCFPFATARAQGTPPSTTKVLLPEDVGKAMPATVFFHGQSATVQMRNAYGLRFPSGAMMLAALVDSSGYSSGIQQKYQGYLLTETTLTVDGRTLLPGAYGFGFLANDQFLVMNIGAMDVLKVPSKTDAAMTRPRPLAIVAGKQSGSYRLYEGKKFVSIRLQ